MARPWHRRARLALLGVALILVTSSAFAGGPGSACAPEVIAWTARASAAIGAGARPLACRSGAAAIRLSPEGVPPIDVDVSDAPGKAFRRAGRFGLSPMVEIADYQQLPAPQRAAFEGLARWLAEHEADVVFAIAPPPDAPPPSAPVAAPLVPVLNHLGIPQAGPWLILSALLAAIASRVTGRAARSSLDRADLAIAAVLFATALALRSAIGPWAPLHVNGQGPFWVLAALFDRPELSSYGPGYHELFAPIVALSPSAPDRALFAANAALSALAAPLAFALARTLGVDRRAAVVAGAILAADAVALRSGATESYFPPIIALVLASELCLAEAATARLRPRAVLSALSAALFAAAAARIHPVAWTPVALAPLVVIAAGPRDRRVRDRLIFAALAAFLLGAAVVLTSGAAIARPLADTGHWNGMMVSAPSRLVPVALSAAALAAVIFLRAPPILIAAAASLVALLSTHDVYEQSALWRASYDRLFLALPAVAVASIVPSRLLRARLAPALLLAAIALSLARARSDLAARTTEQLEYPWLRAHVAALPPGCSLAHVFHVGQRLLFLPDYRGPRGRELHVEGPDDLLAHASEGCLYYARTSLCTSREGSETCTSIERDPRLQLVEEDRIALPAVPSFEALPYAGATVVDGWFRVNAMGNAK